MQKPEATLGASALPAVVRSGSAGRENSAQNAERSPETVGGAIAERAEIAVRQAAATPAATPDDDLEIDWLPGSVAVHP